MQIILDRSITVSKKSADSAVLEKIRNDLTYENPVYWDARKNRRPCRHIPRQIILYRENKEFLKCPRGYRKKLLQIFSESGICPVFIDDRRLCGEKINANFNGTLKDYQISAIKEAIRNEEGTIQAPTGSGKTVMALGLVAEVKLPTLFIVHTSVLLNQFADRIRKFLDIEPGVFGGGIKELRDVTVATVQTLTRCGTDHLEDFFGMVILDEAHHCPAVTFQDIVQRFPAFYRFGLTATPERKDRLHPVLYDCVGPIFYRINPFELTETGDIIKPDVVRIDTEFRHGFRRFRTDYQKMIRRLTLDQKRNGLIADIIKKTHRGRSLVITERIEHAHILHELLKGIFREKVAIIIGATGREQREEVFQSMISGNIQILISTMSLVGEGFDLKELDSLYLTVPTGNIQRATQVIGRILRPSPGKTKAIIYDFVDSQSPVLHAQWKKRRSVYAGFQK